MATLSDFLPYVLPYVAGCSIPLAEAQIRHTVIDFCTHSKVVQAVTEPLPLVAGQRECDLDLSPGSEKIAVLQAWLNGQALTVASDPATLGVPDPPPGTPSRVINLPNNAVLLDCPSASAFVPGLVCRVALRPTRRTTMVDELLINDYPTAIAYGVVAQLALMPGQPFSNPGLVPAYTELYERERTRARIRADLAFAVGSLSVRPRRFA